MNRDDLIRMAREASGNSKDALLENGDDLVMLYLDELERFAALVAAAERDRIASQWDALHEKYMEDPLRRQMMLSYELVAQMIRGQA
jgi:hypothetical protein